MKQANITLLIEEDDAKDKKQEHQPSLSVEQKTDKSDDNSEVSPIWQDLLELTENDQFTFGLSISLGVMMYIVYWAAYGNKIAFVH